MASRLVSRQLDEKQVAKLKLRWNRMHKFIANVFDTTSIHGLTYLTKGGSHAIERFLIAVFIGVGIYGAISISMNTVERYNENPTVISMDRNMFFWNTSFPSLTICPHKKLDNVKLEHYVQNNPSKFSTDELKAEFKRFITILSNATYENLEDIPKNNTFDIDSNDWLDLLYNLSAKFNPEISSGTSSKLYMVDTITELGFCHSVNTKIAGYNSYAYRKSNSWHILPYNNTVVVHPLDGEIYALIINFSSSYELYFHGAMEVPDISKQRYTFYESDYTTVELVALEIITNDDVKDLRIRQRKCRFMNEADVMISNPVYSFNLCRMECRMKMAMKYCGCIPHFYRRTDRNGRTYPVCGFEGLNCISSMKQEIISLDSKTKKIDCHCYANCDNSHFFVQAYRSREWFLGANLQWGINDYPKMQLKREMIFTFSDVLVGIGGLAGLFLGFSILSFVELAFFFVWRVIKEFYLS
ncbi:sodium channel protein Nach [Culicoides brevitarsis]|uniref:sodium channel protein Nach n=1 Tax=Culicoides brevitarsis TaxID=469753 RepID=UPI00307C2DD0